MSNPGRYISITLWEARRILFSWKAPVAILLLLLMAYLTAMIASSGEKAVTGMMGFVLGSLEESDIVTWMWFDNTLFKMNILIACAIAAGVVTSRRYADLQLLWSTPIPRWGWFCIQASGILIAYFVIYATVHLFVPFIFTSMVEGLDGWEFSKLSVLALFSSVSAVTFALLASSLARRTTSSYGLSVVFMLLLALPAGLRFSHCLSPRLQQVYPSASEQWIGGSRGPARRRACRGGAASL